MRQVYGGKETCGTRGGLHIYPERGNRAHEVTLNVQKSAEAIVAERRRAESVGVSSTFGKGETTELTETKMDCPQKDSAEHESIVGASR